MKFNQTQSIFITSLTVFRDFIKSGNLFDVFFLLFALHSAVLSVCLSVWLFVCLSVCFVILVPIKHMRWSRTATVSNLVRDSNQSTKWNANADLVLLCDNKFYSLFLLNLILGFVAIIFIFTGIDCLLFSWITFCFCFGFAQSENITPNKMWTLYQNIPVNWVMLLIWLVSHKHQYFSHTPI